MMPSRTGSIAAALLAVAAAAACAGANPGATRASPRPVAGSEGNLATAVGVRADSARYPYTAADVRFMSAMIGHHAQAITMARRASTRGASPSVRTLAERIINTQQDEIATIQQWLRDRGQRVPEVSADGMMAMHGAEHAGHEMSMPGMISEAQMRQLEQAEGAEFDRLFLTFMIQHHRGAVTMVKELFSTPGAAQDETVFKFASDVNVDQSTEIARMERMLTTLILEGRSP